MKYIDPGDQVLLSLIISVRADTAEFLAEMAKEMDSSVDEVVSAIAEDSLCDVSQVADLPDSTVVPDSCSLEELLRHLN